MKKRFPKWFQVCTYFLLACFVLVTACVGCGSLEQRKTEARIRYYFDLNSQEPLTSPVVESNLLARFPVGTPVNKLQTWLAGRGFGVDGHSIMWETNRYVSYQANDYSDAWFSMRHVQVTANFDNQANIQSIQAQIYSYGL